MHIKQSKEREKMLQNGQLKDCCVTQNDDIRVTETTKREVQEVHVVFTTEKRNLIN